MHKGKYRHMLMRECKMCNELLDEANFRKRKDRNGEYTWFRSYCIECDNAQVAQYKKDHPEKFRESVNRYNNKYYHTNKPAVQVIQCRYYYNKLSPNKQANYKRRMTVKHPDWVEKIWG